ncbi:sterol desaturase family protein [Anabaena sp. UHCC 0253]|nr:sterol desaturase family protein [Anabaena sp. UHCC 0204]MTJ09874.1 sterol desaturase family protein [Anabaena sp. UHCC 0204]MTJ53565.1 sterol desaturase family protein [Anabaena sp. UHCC 0253]
MLPSLPQFGISSLFMFFVLSTRYLIVSSLLYWLLWVRRPQSWEVRRLHDMDERKSKMKSEIRWSLLSCFIFALPSGFMMEMIALGQTKVYINPIQYSWAYLPISLFIYLFLHDTYFYWTHRWLHIPSIYRRFHKIHHESINPTPWTSFSFDPVESMMTAIIIPILIFIIPIHISMVGLLLTLMTIFGVVNHTGYEVYPLSWMRGLWNEHWITPTHHTLHHHKFNCNYGLYFRFWDKLMDTDVMIKTPFMNEIPLVKKNNEMDSSPR